MHLSNFSALLGRLLVPPGTILITGKPCDHVVMLSVEQRQKSQTVLPNQSMHPGKKELGICLAAGSSDVLPVYLGATAVWVSAEAFRATVLAAVAPIVRASASATVLSPSCWRSARTRVRLQDDRRCGGDISRRGSDPHFSMMSAHVVLSSTYDGSWGNALPLPEPAFCNRGIRTTWGSHRNSWSLAWHLWRLRPWLDTA
jgi:hypothetical protein